MTQPSAADLSGILEERGAAHPLSIIEGEDVRLDGTIIIETAYLNGLSAVICRKSIIAQRELLQGKRRGYSAPALTLHKETPPQSAPRRPTGSRRQEEAGAPLHGAPLCEHLPSSARPANTVHLNDMPPGREAGLAGYSGELVQHVGSDAFLHGSAAVTDRQDLGVLLAIALVSDAGVRRLRTPMRQSLFIYPATASAMTVAGIYVCSGLCQFWDTLHTKQGREWADNPRVVLIEFSPTLENVDARRVA